MAHLSSRRELSIQLHEERLLLRKVNGKTHQHDVHPLGGVEELLNAAYFREQA